jgi:DNA polymerase-1
MKETQKNKWAWQPSVEAIQGGEVLSKIHENGIPVDEKYCLEQDAILAKQIDGIVDGIQKTKEVKAWVKETGKPFNPRAHIQVKNLLNDLGHNVSSVSKYVLQKINRPLTKDVITLRHLDDLKNTYLGGFYREAVNGVMRPFFPTHLVSTYRGSSDSPNFTNIPRRDKNAKRITRRAIIPRPGRKILDVDLKGIEVCMGACNSKDPELIKYVTDPSSNMHRDQATEIYLLEQDRVTKSLYDAGKSGFVFPQFYGSYYGNCAPDLWDRAKGEKLDDGMPVLEHLRDQGIKSYKKFEDHIEDVEYQFWNVKFSVYRDWKDYMWEFYQKYGYIELLTGHRCYWSPHGLLGKKECMNYPNQGPAFLCLRWSMFELDKLINEEQGWQSKMLGQIHDDIVWDLEPSELKDLWKVSEQVMCHDIREYWDWIIVPLAIEGEMTETFEEDGNWYRQEEVVI